MKKPSKKLKLLVVFSEKFSDWESCKVISHGLKSAYEALEKNKSYDIQWLPISTTLSETYHGSFKKISEVYSLKEKLKEMKPDRMIFIDHLPHPLHLIEAFLKSEPKLTLPPIDIHVYGDFTFFASQWAKFGRLLKRHPLRLICSSPKQSALLSGFLSDKSAPTVQTLFFPVDPSKYFYDAESKSRMRKKWGIGANDKIILYTGRLSLQKNIVRLIQEFAKLHDTISEPVHLLIAGVFDDIGAGIFGINTPEGYYFSRVEIALQALREKVRSKIHFLGQIKQNELRDAYCASDVFTSLSLYHDEDYGMSVAEALSCGLPAVISDWGGFSSFAKSEYFSHAVPVALHNNGLLLSSSTLQENLKKNLSKVLSDEKRLILSKKFSEDFSIAAATRRLQESFQIENPVFGGFNWKLDFLASTVHPGKPRDSFMPKKGAFYEDIYQPYFTEKLEKNMQWNLKEDLAVWLYDYLEVSQRKPYTEAKPEAKDLIGNFWPFCEPYFSALQPVFLFEGWKKESVALGKRWQARDGVLPLYWFFRSAAPSDFPAKLWVHRDLENLVPPIWQEHVGLYHIESKAAEASFSEPDSLLITGLMSPPFINEDELESRLDYLIEKMGPERMKKLRIFIFMPFRGSSLFWSHFHEEIYLSMPLKIIKKLGAQVQPIGWQQLDAIKSLRNFLYFELNEGWVIKDTSIMHMALARGARLLDSPTKAIADSETVELSRYHHVRLSKPGNFKRKSKQENHEEIINEYFKIGEFLYKKRFNPVFPEWYQSFCKSSLGKQLQKSV